MAQSPAQRPPSLASGLRRAIVGHRFAFCLGVGLRRIGMGGVGCIRFQRVLGAERSLRRIDVNRNRILRRDVRLCRVRLCRVRLCRVRLCCRRLWQCGFVGRGGDLGGLCSRSVGRQFDNRGDLLRCLWFGGA